MVFSSYEFLLGFFPVVTAGYWLLSHFHHYDLAKILLVAASFYFYAQGAAAFFPYFMGSVLANYVLGSVMCRLPGEKYKSQRKWILLVGVAGNVGLLGYYKYMDFFLENINALMGTDFVMKSLVLPIGISFFTFQLIAFLVDCSRGETKEYHILEYLLFITFFPQLIVGPIVHHGEITPQFENPENRKWNHKNVSLGIFIFAIGCGKKMLLADPMNNSAAEFYSSIKNSVPMWESWFYTLEYSLSYYFDLSGYTDMAIGMALFYNIQLPDNFASPWKARNMQQYWQRQHITLSRFLGGYVFRGVFRKGCWWRNYYIATMVTMLVSGIWHGAGWNFIIWGLINGVLVSIGAWENYHKKYPPYLLGVGLTFLWILLTRVVFVAENMTDAWTVYRSMFDVSALASMGWGQAWRKFLFFVANHQKLGLLTVFGLALCWFAPNTRQMAEKFRADWKHFLFAGVLLTVCLLRMNQVVQFLYFQF